MAPTLDIDHLPYVAAVHQRPRPKMPPNIIVIHDGETNEGPTAAEGMAAYFASGHTTGSAHICVDNNSGVRCAPDAFRTNGAGGMNDTGLHIEQAGRASQSAKDWQDPYSLAVIANCASIVSQWTTRYPNIRRKFLHARDLASGERNGITSHREVTAAGFPGNDGHSDPGPAYPIDYFMSLVTGTSPSPSPSPLTTEVPVLFYMTIDSISWYLAVLDYGVKKTDPARAKFSTAPKLVVSADEFAWLEEACSPGMVH